MKQRLIEVLVIILSIPVWIIYIALTITVIIPVTYWIVTGKEWSDILAQ